MEKMFFFLSSGSRERSSGSHSRCPYTLLSLACLWCAPGNVTSRQGITFFLPFSTSHKSKTICCRSLTPPRTTPSACPSTQSKQNAYRFPQLSGSQLPASGMTFLASLCCPTDVLSASNRKKHRNKNNDWEGREATQRNTTMSPKEMSIWSMWPV